VNSFASDAVEERKLKVAMRTIGHEVLLDIGDSTSRVLPIEKVDDRYKISFASDFAFNPEDLVAAIDRAVVETHIAKSYLVEVEECETGDVVYAYLLKESKDTAMVPCKTRALPSTCYSVLVTILDENAQLVTSPEETLGSGGSIPPASNGGNNKMFLLLVIPFSLLAAWSLRIWKKRKNSRAHADGVLIGEYFFDKRNMELTIQDQKMELTSKEADLLYLLHSSANATVEREVMLKEVWGDEGDYVGRTLDVFISKLRKKLEADPSVRIANIRGVGYKLILND